LVNIRSIKLNNGILKLIESIQDILSAKNKIKNYDNSLYKLASSNLHKINEDLYSKIISVLKSTKFDDSKIATLESKWN